MKTTEINPIIDNARFTGFHGMVVLLCALLCAGNEVFYAAGLTISEKAKVTAETREILHITFTGGNEG